MSRTTKGPCITPATSNLFCARSSGKDVLSRYGHRGRLAGTRRRLCYAMHELEIKGNTLSTQIDNMSRAEIVNVLEQHGGYQCYDHESTELLRDVLRVDIDSGILPASVLP
jgi:hypothetical protein